MSQYRVLPWAAGPLTLLENMAKVPDRQVTKWAKKDLKLVGDSHVTQRWCLPLYYAILLDHSIIYRRWPPPRSSTEHLFRQLTVHVQWYMIRSSSWHKSRVDWNSQGQVVYCKLRAIVHCRLLVTYCCKWLCMCSVWSLSIAFLNPALKATSSSWTRLVQPGGTSTTSVLHSLFSLFIIPGVFEPCAHQL